MEEHNIFIGQASEILHCNKSLLRFYEKEFSLNIPRIKSGRRIYGAKELESFRYIDKLKKNGYNNTQIKAVLSSERLNSENTKNESDEEDFKAENNIVPVSENASAILELINQLKKEVTELKNLSEFRNKETLIKENEDLKRKLKEKTYELVETREKLTNIKKYGNKKMFKL